MIPVDREQYAEAMHGDLPAEIGETIDVDRSGYAPAVASTYGEEYMDDRLFIFDEAQFDEETVDGREYLDPLLDDIYARSRILVEDVDDMAADDGMIETVTEFGPVVATVDGSLDGTTMRLTASAEPVAGLSEYREQLGRYRSIMSMEADDVQDDAFCSSVREWVEENGDSLDHLPGPGSWEELGSVDLGLDSFEAGAVDMRVTEGSITSDHGRFSLQPLSEETGDERVYKAAHSSINGLIDAPSYVKGVHRGVSLVIAPRADADDRPLSRADIERAMGVPSTIVRSTRRSYHRDFDEVDGFYGYAECVHRNLNIVVLGDMVVEPGNEHGSVTTFGEPPEDPEYTFLASSGHGRVNVYYPDPTTATFSQGADGDGDRVWTELFGQVEGSLAELYRDKVVTEK